MLKHEKYCKIITSLGIDNASQSIQYELVKKSNI